MYDYEAVEDIELSFDEGATITGLVSITIQIVHGFYANFL
jgi:hypothetical protein